MNKYLEKIAGLGKPISLATTKQIARGLVNKIIKSKGPVQAKDIASSGVEKVLKLTSKSYDQGLAKEMTEASQGSIRIAKKINKQLG